LQNWKRKSKFLKDNTMNNNLLAVAIYIISSLIFLIIGFIGGSRYEFTRVMGEAHKLGYTQHLINSKHESTYIWRDFHDVEKHYSGLEEEFLEDLPEFEVDSKN